MYREHTIRYALCTWPNFLEDASAVINWMHLTYSVFVELCFKIFYCLYLLLAWREAPFYPEREWVALGWIKAVMLIAINGWNRLAISFRSEVGTYQPKSTP